MTKTRVTIALAATLIATPALAADLALKGPAPFGPSWSWAGFYAGVNVGYGIGDPSVTENSSAPIGPGALFSNSAGLTADGVIGGAQIGYNWVTAPNWLVGVEADFQESAQKHTDTFSTNFPPPVPTTDTVGLNIDWFGTARARVGYIADNANLWYVTGGYAYGRSELALTSTNFVVPGVVANGFTHQVTSGWTLGGGLESHLFGNWTAKLEYLYVDLGTISGSAAAFIGPGVPAATAISASAHIHDNIARAGLNYKF
jgi:outer membrane immunogenic protein